MDDFFPEMKAKYCNCVLKCEEERYTLQENGFSTLCVHICICKFDLCAKEIPHTSQEYLETVDNVNQLFVGWVNAFSDPYHHIFYKNENENYQLHKCEMATKVGQ